MAAKSGRPPRSRSDILAMRAKIARVAQNLFHEEGFDAVSIRRLAKETGCAPMTIYAHFDSKTDILRHLWADVLGSLFAQISQGLPPDGSHTARLGVAAQIFVDYWLTHTDHFRLVFMSNDVTRSDVNTFVQDQQTVGHFRYFFNLISAALPADQQNDKLVKCKTDTLIAGMIGIALCHNTIGDYPWASAPDMASNLVAGLLAPDALPAV